MSSQASTLYRTGCVGEYTICRSLTLILILHEHNSTYLPLVLESLRGVQEGARGTEHHCDKSYKADCLSRYFTFKFGVYSHTKRNEGLPRDRHSVKRVEMESSCSMKRITPADGRGLFTLVRIESRRLPNADWISSTNYRNR